MNKQFNELKFKFTQDIKKATVKNIRTIKQCIKNTLLLSVVNFAQKSDLVGLLESAITKEIELI